MNNRILSKPFSATVAYIGILNLKQQQDPTIFRFIQALHMAARRHKPKRTPFHVCSSISGLIIVAPDAFTLELFNFLKEIGADCEKTGMPIRIGVSHGDVEPLLDTDELVNFIGRPMNYSARLSASKKNRGCLIEAALFSFCSKSLMTQQCPEIRISARILNIAGKSHDKDGFSCYHAAFTNFKFLERAREATLSEKRRPKMISGTIIAYDLPHFSAGDRSQLSKRFRGVSDAFLQWRRSSFIPEKSQLALSPGGDGGIVVITESKQKIDHIVSKLVDLLTIENYERSEGIQVLPRIGVHYGTVILYRNAENIERPTGVSCFIADDLANDELARSKNSPIYSELLADAVSMGSEAYLTEKYEYFPAAETGPAKGLKRFCIKNESQSSKDPSMNPILEKLAGRHGNWKLQK